jgi:hypothetical protein
MWTAFSRLSTSTMFVGHLLSPPNEDMEDPETVDAIVELLLVRDGVPLRVDEASCAARM